MLHPIVALNRVLDEYRDYLLTEFRAKDPGLKDALERELDRPLFLAQEPFFQAHRPYRYGQRWRDLPIDPRLAQVLDERARRHGSSVSDRAYIHQSQAIAELLSPQARPLVVTTGTGSGKTEAFLVPVIQNAVEDAVRYRQDGLTAILVYPMNALANDQLQRIEDYLQRSGFAGTVRVAKYDRGTTQSQREELRHHPPHILLTNYMMLEYLLIRPADRDDIFANHRCRFLVLDEVHTYRGTLGSNIALLIRRVRTHLSRARQDWHVQVDEDEHPRRFPSLIPVGTSATIKSMDDGSLQNEERLLRRDDSIREFFSRLTGVPQNTVHVISEELETMEIPSESTYPPIPSPLNSICDFEPEALRQALCQLAGMDESAALEQAVQRCRILWDLNQWLVRSPLSTSQICETIRQEVLERRDTPDDCLLREVESALILGAALPDGTPGALRLRVHRFLRGGWRFHRCINPHCGRLYPMGEERCTTCNHRTAPLYLCRNCGADYLRFVETANNILQPSSDMESGPEWYLYNHHRLEAFESGNSDEPEEENEDRIARQTQRRNRQPRQMRGRPVLHASLDLTTGSYSQNEEEYDWQVTLAPARNQCLCCGGSAGNRNVITPVALGTSAAMKVISEGILEALHEANQNSEGYDGKDRLLIFSDSRQDAAHQARFIIFASRYDRMRRRVMRILDREGQLSFQSLVEQLGNRGVEERDNPYVPDGDIPWISHEALQRIRAWEEAPLLDEISVNAGYRATLFNLGLVGVQYHQLSEYLRAQGDDLASRLGITPEQLEYGCRCLLDEMRIRGAFSRPLLRYHPSHPSFPETYRAANWERRVKQPKGFAADDRGMACTYRDGNEVPPGITSQNAWRREGAGGRSPSLEKLLRHMLAFFGGTDPAQEDMEAVLRLLQRGHFILASELYGFRERMTLMQVNAETVFLYPIPEDNRYRCCVCSKVVAGGTEGFPCPRCHGSLVLWRDSDVNENRTVQRIRSPYVINLEAREHTAQVPNSDRVDYENDFKAGPNESKVNVLACSPTLEMGIDVGGLDAVALRNVPPRPDNYAQRGGRAGRRTRMGLVIGYARSTPHDQYFYDNPSEMISGEVPAPIFSLGNRDVLQRHLCAIAFGAAEPGLRGKMVDYISPTGELNQPAIDELIAAVAQQSDSALAMAEDAFGEEIISQTEIGMENLHLYLQSLPQRIQDLFNRTSRQVIELRRPLENYATQLRGPSAGRRAGDLVAHLLGIESDRFRNQNEADDRSAGYPLRRFAEYGILPGYEFPTQPASLRLLGDDHEEDSITVDRKLGISQFQPDAPVYARTKRWKVIGLDLSSPWNPRSEEPTWSYRICRDCHLRYSANQPRCPRCNCESPGQAIPAMEYAGFLGIRNESPILDEEERYAMRNLVQINPQWSREVTGRWSVGPGWSLRLSRNEEVYWLNEGMAPTASDGEEGIPLLHSQAKGFCLCPECGSVLKLLPPEDQQSRGRRRTHNRDADNDLFGHGPRCTRRGFPPQPIALAAKIQAEVLRLLIPLPENTLPNAERTWAVSLATALLQGIKRRYMLSNEEIVYGYENPWLVREGDTAYKTTSLTFIDPSLGGTGYLRKIAEEFDRVAVRSLEHLNHTGCENACYRCLKSYDNQRFHDDLNWPLIIPHLEAIAAGHPLLLDESSRDLEDPTPWLEAYAAGVGSPLELQFLRLFERAGFIPERQHPISIRISESPITIADFAFPDRRIAIYVDGAAFHTGHNIRRDRHIRNRLSQMDPPWRVVVWTASDLREGISLIHRLFDSVGQSV